MFLFRKKKNWKKKNNRNRNWKKKMIEVLFRNCEGLEVNKCLVVWLFKHLENKSQNCFVVHSEHFVFPFHSFLLTPNLWPHYTIERPYDLMICGLIVESWSMSKHMGTYLCSCYESKHLTLNTERKYLVNLVRFSG